MKTSLEHLPEGKRRELAFVVKAIRDGFRRNEQMLSLNPRYLVAFAGNGVLERLVIQAKA